MDPDFLEFAERQLSDRSAASYVSEYTLFGTSAPELTVGAGLRSAMAQLHDRADDFQAERQRAASARGQRVQLHFVSSSHQVTPRPRRWWHPADWFRASAFIVSIVASIELWEMDTPQELPDNGISGIE